MNTAVTPAPTPLDDRSVLDALAKVLVALRAEPVVNEVARHLGLWVVGLSPPIRNPVLVRAAGEVRSMKELHALLHDFRAVLCARGRDWGLLVAGQLPDGAEDSSSDGPTILLTSLSDLQMRLKSESFAEILLDLYRQRACGRG